MDRICSFVFRAPVSAVSFFFFFNDTATTEIYTLSLHDALPISVRAARDRARPAAAAPDRVAELAPRDHRSEEHTSELQSLAYLVCRLLLEKKKKKQTSPTDTHTRNTCRHSLKSNLTVHRMHITR